MDTVDKVKGGISGVFAVLTALWGWFGWMVIAWMFCMGLDYATGTAVAIKDGEWASSRARDGLWHKFGSIVAVAVSGLLDIVIGHLCHHALPTGVTFNYAAILCPLVVVWYIITETGSILENAGKLGAQYPAWLTNAIAALKKQVDAEGDKQHPPN